MRSSTLSALAIAGVVLSPCPVEAQGAYAVSAATGQRWQNPTGPQLAVSQAVGFVRNPQAALASASVEDANGKRAGKVESVTTNPDGTARTVRVALGSRNRKVVSIDARTMRFNPDDDVAQTSLTLPEMNSLPAKR